MISGEELLTTGSHGFFGAAIGWFANLIYMREKFVSKSECRECKAASNKRFDDGAERMQRIEDKQLETFGLVKEIHGALSKIK